MDAPEWGFFDLQEKDESACVARFRFKRKTLLPINVDLIPGNCLPLIAIGDSFPRSHSVLRELISKAKKDDRILTSSFVLATRFGTKGLFDLDSEEIYQLRDFYVGLSHKLPVRAIPPLIENGCLEFSFLAPGYDYLKNNPGMAAVLTVPQLENLSFFALQNYEVEITEKQASKVSPYSGSRSDLLLATLLEGIDDSVELDPLPEFPTVEDFSNIAKKLGMMLPPHVSEETILEYILHNAPEYKSVVTSSGSPRTLEESSDFDMLSSRKIYVSYKSRAQLLGQVRQWEEGGEIVFRPLNKELLTSANNQMTNCSMDDPEELWDERKLLLGIGHKNDFYLSCEDDLITAFEAKESNAIFASPVDGSVMPLPLVDDVEELIRSYPVSAEGQSLLKVISRIYTKVSHLEGLNIQLLREYNNLPLASRAVIDTHMMEVFYIGMYFRRWKGPGHPYPVGSSATFGEDPDAIANEKLFALEEKRASYSADVTTFLSKISSVDTDKRKTFVVNKHFSFEKIYTFVINRNYCIRMASTIFIATAAYHFSVYKGIPIEGVEDFRNVAHIG